MCSNLERITLHTFTWTIENFRACTKKNNESLDSPVFTAESLDGTSWFVKLYPEGDSRTTKEFVSCFIYRCVNSAGPNKVECDITLEVIDKNNKSLVKYPLFQKFEKGKGFGIVKIIKNNFLNTYSSYDSLTIIVSLRKILPKFLTKSSCCTKIVTDHFSFKWNVRNFNSSSVNIKPVSFSENLQFEISISMPEDDVEIRIRRTKGFVKSQKLICCVTLLDLQGEKTDSKEAILQASDPVDDDTWKFPLFLKKSKITAEKDKYLKEDYFILKFDLDLSAGKTLESTEDIECHPLDYFWKSEEDPPSTLKNDLRRVLTNSIHTDVVLHADQKVFLAHKVILCARSPVFLSMFKQDMIEKQSGVINISDIEAETLSFLLEFIYTGDAEISNWESALKLLLASDRYQVLSLKEKCSSDLESLLTDENVCDVLFTADLVQQESLKVCAVNHIKKNCKKIFKSTEWQHLIEKNLKLASEIFSEVSTLLNV